MELPGGLNPQQVGSCLTYYRRYTLVSLCSLQSLDDDAVSASAPTAKTKPSISKANFEKALVAIQEERYTVEQLKEAFELTDLQTKALLLL